MTTAAACNVSRHAITVPDGTQLRSDLTDHDTRVPVEAKAAADRASIRMGIGQLADSARSSGRERRPARCSCPSGPRPTSSSCSTHSASA